MKNIGVSSQPLTAKNATNNSRQWV